MKKRGIIFNSEIAKSTYRKQIKKHLESIINCCGYSDLHLYIKRLLRSLIEYHELISDDPFLIVTMAFYNAISYKDQWVNYTTKQYSGALEILKSVSETKLTEKKIYDALSALEDCGFDINPFDINV